MPRGITCALSAAAALLGLAVGAGGAPAGDVAPATWEAVVPLPGAIDIAGPRSDGRYAVTAEGRLGLLDPADGTLTPFARGPRGYRTTTGEPYIASPPRGLRGPGDCSFGRDSVYALDASAAAPGVFRISRQGVARRFASFEGGIPFPSGIAFDRIGRFDHRLLVVVEDLAAGSQTTLYAFDCEGRAERVVRDGPRLEGGIVVAPRSFGRFGGALIAPDEHSGRVWALGANGGARLVAESGLPAGPDIGVESAGFVPRLRAGGTALLADPLRGAILGIGRRELRLAGVQRGDLLIAAEAVETRTITVRCDPGCAVREVALGADAASGATAKGHAEGHISFYRGG